MSLKNSAGEGSAPTTIVPLGTVVRQHGVSKNSLNKWKIDLFVPGGEVFKDSQRLYFFAPPKDGRLLARAQNELAAEIQMLEHPCEPLGAKWGSTPSVMITLPDNLNPLNKMVGIARADFPQADDFYICDLLGREVRDLNSAQDSYVVAGIFNASQVSGLESWVVKIKSSKGTIFEVPLQPLLDDPPVFAQIHPADPTKSIGVAHLREWLDSFRDLGERPDDQ